MASLLPSVLFCWLFIEEIFSVSLPHDDVIYPMRSSDHNLVTMINCENDESRRFRYVSNTNLWNEIDGRISLTTDVILHCLGSKLKATGCIVLSPLTHCLYCGTLLAGEARLLPTTQIGRQEKKNEFSHESLLLLFTMDPKADSDDKYGNEALRYVVQLENLDISEEHSSVGDETSKRKKRGFWDPFQRAWTKVKNFVKRIFGYGDEETTEETGGEEETEVTTENESMDYTPLYSTPFEFVQFANGSVPEVRFVEYDKDIRVRNFKRHLVDAFATQLSLKPQHRVVIETSVLGDHLSNYNIKNAEQMALFSAEEEVTSAGEETITVRRHVGSEDMLSLPHISGGTLNSWESLGLDVEQVQKFKQGKMTSCKGASSIQLLPRNERRRRSQGQEEDDNIFSYFRVKSEFVLELVRRQRRSAEDSRLLDHQTKSLSFMESSRRAEVEADSSAKEKLQELHRSMGNSTAFVQSLFTDTENSLERSSIVLEIVELEISVDMDQNPDSMATAVRNTLDKQTVMMLSSEEFKTYRDLLHLLACCGGPVAEEVLLSYLTEATLSVQERQQVADIASDLRRPTPEFLSAMLRLLKSSDLDPVVQGATMLSLSNLAADRGEEEKRPVAEHLCSILEENNALQCEEHPLIMDALEASGNLRHPNTVPCSLRIASHCRDSDLLQIGCVHAVHHQAHDPRVQEWMQGICDAGSCDLKQALLESLGNQISSQQIARDTTTWPRQGFNQIDGIIREQLLVATPDSQCWEEAAIHYFEKKLHDEAQDVVRNFYIPESEPMNPSANTRHKRDLFEDIQCEEWSDGSNSDAPSEESEEIEDQNLYNRKRRCHLSRRLGVNGARTIVHANMFAGVKVPSDPSKYLLLTKFVSEVDFLGEKIEIGSFRFTHKDRRTMGSVRILGKTRQEFQHESCTPTSLLYKPITHVPVFVVTLAAVQLSLGIHLSPNMGIDTDCPKQDVYQFRPLTTVRVAGEAVATVLFLKAAVNLGGNFNYRLHFNFAPYPDMCLNGEYGFDPMSISLEAYFQIWNIFKESWNTPNFWQPNFLKWQVSRGSQSLWFNNTCVFNLPTITTTTTSTSRPDRSEDENFIPVVED